MSEYSTVYPNIKAGQVIAQEIRGKVVISAWNHDKQKVIPIGSVTPASGIYEKPAPFLKKPSPSFCLSQSELAAVEEAGARVICIISPSGRAFYISLNSFKQNKVTYFSRTYGYQWRCALKFFSDNPPLEQPGPLAPRDRQMSLFGDRGR